MRAVISFEDHGLVPIDQHPVLAVPFHGTRQYLAFGVAAAANFPVLILSMFWKGLTTRGALFGGYGGLVSAVTLVVLSKSVWVDVLHNPAPLFPYGQPALFAMPVAFLLAYIFSKTDSSARAKLEIDAFEDQYVRGQTGFGASSASNH